jgi:two-component system, chemotaxis family, protein-glutamate methylesterase/glutaminase
VIAPARTVVEPNSLAAARVMVCDDSAAIRGAIARMLEADPTVRVVARVANGQLAIDELKRTPVDVLVLDIESMCWCSTSRCRSWTA